MTPKPDDRAENRGRAARRRWREIFDSLLPVIVAAIIVILALLAVLSISVFSTAGKAQDAARLASATLERQKVISANGCDRVQLLRDDQNVTAWGVYTVLNQPQPDMTKLAALFAKVDPATRALLGALVAGGQDGRDLMGRVRDEQRYGPPTDCARASKDARYRFPRPVPFSQVADCYDPATPQTSRIPEGRCPRR